MASSVDLPAPLGPMSPVRVPRADLDRHPGDRLHAAEVTATSAARKIDLAGPGGADGRRRRPPPDAVLAAAAGSSRRLARPTMA